MSDRQHTRYQQKVIQRYYDNREAIDTQRLSEQVTTLYLASGKKAEKSWEAVETTMRRLGVRASRVDHIMKSRDVTVLAELVKDLEAGVVKLEPPKKEKKKPEGG